MHCVLYVCMGVSVHACCIMYIDVVYMHMHVYCVDHVCSVRICGHYMYTECASLGVLQKILHWEYYTTLATHVGREIEIGVLCTRRCGSSLHMLIKNPRDVPMLAQKMVRCDMTTVGRAHVQ